MIIFLRVKMDLKGKNNFISSTIVIKSQYVHTVRGLIRLNGASYSNHITIH